LFSNPPQLQPQETWRNVSKHHHLTWNMKNLNELTHKYEHMDLKSQVSGFECLSESTELGGALYIMFENHMRSWPLLRTP
jgi:hypothetical protein